MTAAGKVYVVVTAVRTGDIRGSLLTDGGDLLWSASASNIGWLQHDLTKGRRARRLAAIYPDGFETVVTPRDGDVPAEVRERYAAKVARRFYAATAGALS